MSIGAFNFNSRPSARGDDIAPAGRAGIVISIHAPPRGATELLPNDRVKRISISIHAPPRGATPVMADFHSFDSRFQFTPLREGRRRSCAGRSKQMSLFQFTPLREGRRIEAASVSALK